jgi:LacI family transcriptional regulator
MTTIKDIARLLGIAPSTVARALNDHPHIRDVTKARVRATADKLGYVAHSAARSMRSRASTLVGLVVPEVEHTDLAIAAKAMAECCNEAGFQIVLSLTEDDPKKEYAHLYALASARAAGIAIMPTASPLRESIALLKRLPFVQLLRHSQALESDWFALDDEFGIYEATRHLIELGHRKVAYLGGSEGLSTGGQRLRGYRRALGEADIAYDNRLIATIPPIGFDAHDAFRVLYEAARPTAIVLGAPRIAIGALEAIGDLGLRVPDDLSVIGFGDQAWMKGWGPGLSTIRMPARDLALACGSFLLRRIREKSRELQRLTDLCQTLHRPALVLRGSAAAPR